ncbi:hypothetical protein EPUS_06522 [Endocarpon pusillum Z07020]|uniref:RNase H type-1 domain-containing protein n=1 Tax=Endocarpon pusillum (strain Z07020 / HMAS-L-300199) TaxID=1263415 RepID=U1GIJ6_ENDPU|nr:uncharacterized protein EPUS_06522 [Endocarpon pusillum Z07020]ERF71963.1 hypothetical protein EPUS_06522 [Endocarpon pusillum Z07020]
MFQRDSEEEDNDDRVFVLGEGVNRFMPQWDEQILGPANKFRIKTDYNMPPKPEELQVAALLACSQCELTWLVGKAGQSAGAGHPSHHTLYHEYAGTSRSLVVRTDGACINNGQPRAEAGVGVYFAPNSRYNVSSPLEDSCAPTNQRAELHALLRAMLVVRKDIVPTRSILVNRNRDKKHFRLVLVTDSSYAVECMCKHWKGWKVVDGRKVLKNQKGKHIANSDVLLAIQDEVEELSRVGVQVAYYHVRREFNREADALAKAGVSREVEVEGKPLHIGVMMID